MRKIIKWIGDLPWYVPFIIGIVAIIVIASYGHWLHIQDDETIIIEGKIISVEYLGLAKGYIRGDSLRITFDNGESYTIMNNKDIDFTANSKIIMKLWWDGDDDYWEIKRIYKVPSED